jgi:hypothetical protein
MQVFKDAGRDIEQDGAIVTPVQVDLANYEGVEKFYAELKAAARPVEVIAIHAGLGGGGDFCPGDGTEVLAVGGPFSKAASGTCRIQAQDEADGFSRGKPLLRNDRDDGIGTARLQPRAVKRRAVAGMGAHDNSAPHSPELTGICRRGRGDR